MRIIASSLIIAMIFAALLTAACGGQTGPEERIAFVSNRDGNSEIYVVNADGSGTTRLTNNDAGDGSPALSPDGQRIVFTSRRDDFFLEIYAVNADGTGLTRLTNNNAHDWRPAWSPDGRRIAFISDRDGNKEIYAVSADGSETAQLTNSDAYVHDFASGRRTRGASRSHQP